MTSKGQFIEASETETESVRDIRGTNQESLLSRRGLFDGSLRHPKFASDWRDRLQSWWMGRVRTLSYPGAERLDLGFAIAGGGFYDLPDVVDPTKNGETNIHGWFDKEFGSVDQPELLKIPVAKPPSGSNRRPSLSVSCGA